MPEIPDREEKEKAYARLVAKLLKTYGGNIFELIGDPPDLANIPDDFWDEESLRWVAALAPFGSKVYLDAARQLMEQAPMQVDWTLINERAAKWASTYTFKLVHGINDTTRKVASLELERLRTSIPEFFNRQMTRGDLEKRLQEDGLFGPVRAEMIAVTEVTRAATEGELGLSRELAKQGIEMVPIWQTSNDDLVCDICRPLNERAADTYGGENNPVWIHPETGEQIGSDDAAPPAHPRCRCGMSHELPKVE